MNSRMDWVIEHVNWQGDDCLRPPFGTSNWYHTIPMPNGKWGKAHRVMCELVNGKPSESSLNALHSCGNQWCCNPRHLRWGTQAENVKDAIEQGGIKTCEESPKAKLTNNDVREARRDRGRGMSYNQLSKKYGIARGAMWHAVNGTQWKNLE